MELEEVLEEQGYSEADIEEKVYTENQLTWL